MLKSTSITAKAKADGASNTGTKGVLGLINRDRGGSSSVIGKSDSSKSLETDSFDYGSNSYIEGDIKPIESIDSVSNGEVNPSIIDINNPPEPKSLLSFSDDSDDDDLEEAKKSVLSKAESNSFDVNNDADYKVVNSTVPEKQYVENQYKKGIAFNPGVLNRSFDNERVIKQNPDLKLAFEKQNEAYKKEYQDLLKQQSKANANENKSVVNNTSNSLKKMAENSLEKLREQQNEVVGKNPEGKPIKRSDLASGFVGLMTKDGKPVIQNEKGDYVLSDDNKTIVDEKDVESFTYTPKQLEEKLQKDLAYAEQLQNRQRDLTSANDIDDMTLRSLGLTIDEKSASEERNKAIEEGRDFDLNNVKVIPTGKVDIEAVIASYVNGNTTDNTIALFDSNPALRDRVVELVNQGKNYKQVLNDDFVRSQISFFKTLSPVDLASIAITPLIGPSATVLFKNVLPNVIKRGGASVVNNVINNFNNSGRLSQLWGNNKRTISMMNAAKNAAGPVSSAASVIGTSASLANMGSKVGNDNNAININPTYSRSLSNYNPFDSKINDYGLNSLDVGNLEGVESLDNSRRISFDTHLPDSVKEVFTPLEGDITNENIKNKVDYVRELLDNGWIETLIKEANLSPREKDGVLKELINVQQKLTSIAFDHVGEAFSDAQWIVSHPDDYTMEQRVSAKNVLDMNADNFDKDEVANAYRTGSYLDSKLKQVRFDNAYKNRNQEPEVWNEVFDSYTNEEKQNYLENSIYEPNTNRLVGVDVSNNVTRQFSKAQNAYEEAQKELKEKVSELTGWDRLSKTKAGQKISKVWNTTKKVVGNLFSNVVNPLKALGNIIHYGVELPINVFGDSLKEAGYTTVGNFVNTLKDNISNVRASISGKADVTNKTQYEKAYATKQARGLVSGMSKIAEGVGLAGSDGGIQVARGVAEVLVSLDPSISTNQVRNAANQTLNDLGLNNPEEVIAEDNNNVNTTTEDEVLKKKKKVTNDIPDEEGIASNASGFNSGLGADTINYLYGRYGSKNILR